MSKLRNTALENAPSKVDDSRRRLRRSSHSLKIIFVLPHFAIVGTMQYFLIKDSWICKECSLINPAFHYHSDFLRSFLFLEKDSPSHFWFSHYINLFWPCFTLRKYNMSSLAVFSLDNKAPVILLEIFYFARNYRYFWEITSRNTKYIIYIKRWDIKFFCAPIAIRLGLIHFSFRNRGIFPHCEYDRVKRLLP